MNGYKIVLLKAIFMLYRLPESERVCSGICRLWFLYKTEGEPKGVSINSFCISNNIPYTAFYDWFKKTQKKVVPVEVEGIPEELIQSDNTHEDVTEDKPKRTTPHKGSIMVTIRTREGLCIQKKGLDYQGLKTLVEKLEGLC